MDEIFSMRRQVQFAETDLAGVMHFSNYFRWMEEVEHAWWRSLGLSVQTVADPVGSIGWPRVSVQCEYAAPLRFEDVVELRHRVVSVGEKSLTHEVE
ncbi:MAG: acyl-CoA thioesterase, partial [Planctomycetes bacterium]|nr:acyl-CoA thioesterase [Planctomycetota bacterium]